MHTQTKVPIDGLLDGYESALTKLGYSITTKLLFVRRADLIIRRHQNLGMDYLDTEIISSYAREIDEKYFNGELQRIYYYSVKREIKRFTDYAYSEMDKTFISPLCGPRQELTPEFERIANDFIWSEDFHPNTRNDIRWTVYKYFAWLEVQGFENLGGTGYLQIQKFFLYCSDKYSPSTVFNSKLYLKKLYSYLYAIGQSESDYKEFFSFSVDRDKKVFPALPKSDIAKLLDAIDRTTIKGKRNYAIMMLGTVLGLRACDVVALKLTDIDWRLGEIKIVQSKTSNPVVLPLTQDVGEALQDYILNARPSSESQEVFLRLRAPHTALAAAVTIGEIYEDCCIKAGLPVSKRFHNLRRSLGTSMVSSGVSVYDVAQVLGDKLVESTKPYLAADTEHLKMCALSFDGIAPMGGTY